MKHWTINHHLEYYEDTLISNNLLLPMYSGRTVVLFLQARHKQPQIVLMEDILQYTKDSYDLTAILDFSSGGVSVSVTAKQ